jgi:hypothetical protein
MSRRLSCLVGLLLLVSTRSAFSQDSSKPAAVERAVGLQRALADAKDLLAANRPAAAAGVLEAQLLNADGSKAFLGLLRDAYVEELRTLSGNPARATLLRERLILLGESLPTANAPAAKPQNEGVTASEPNRARDAAIAFQKGNWSDATRLFAEAAKSSPLSVDESTAWAYCRIKLAAARMTAPGFNDAAGVEREIADAVALAPGQERIQELGLSVLATLPVPTARPTPTPTSSAGNVVETASFRVRFSGSREAAETLAKAAEARRKTLFERWSGPPSADWQPRCEITLHATADEYAKATGKPALGTGHASIRFNEGRVAERRLDLRADDVTLVDDALPRELMHVVLADLFPNEPPPRWAEAGMAVLACSTDEVGRYSRTLPRCARDGQLFAVAALFELKDFPAAEKITGFYCESVSLVEFLVKLRGERNFTIFLRDTHRYGIASALRKTYDLDGPAALEHTWRERTLTSTRAQSP